MLNNLDNSVSELIDGKVIFITGGTGTFGTELTTTILKSYSPKKVIIFSRDEYKQYKMKQHFLSNSKFNNILRFFIGDIRDYERLQMATKNVDVIFHAAAMKQVDTIEYNPFEAIKTNIYGTENVIKSAIHNNVKKVIAISTDKCVNPVNLYGATKLCLEKLIIHANLISTNEGPIFSVLRYGNVLNSRGSVVPMFKEQQKTGCFTITDEQMSRFTLTINQAINFVLNCSSIMIGGEIFVPMLPSYNILQLARCINKDCSIKIVGKRPGEKIHESMLSATESNNAIIVNDCYFVITPDIQIVKNYQETYGTKYMNKNKEYSSGSNELINDEILKTLIN